MTRNGGARNGVGMILDERLSKEVIEVYRKNDRLIRVKLLCGKEIVNVISAYAPQVGLDSEEKRQFWEDLDEVRDASGEAIMDFSQSYDLFLANTWFKKRDSHLITFWSGANATQIDFLLTRSADRQSCLNCKVIPGESVVTQHRLLVMTIRLKEKANKKGRPEEQRIRWWTFRDANAKVFTE
ncbi:uncharacterized protein LOC110737547 [Chenopodium quinoa]|uniref:uncharacterized protein LOC110737547 n=1 Tax=Chenopodium quinoa TaxID=63459 RepID=UPI000B77BE14|nr:uncharacterized protein LOC110737547 [Chenopodium quinoa]